jgi:hypothetical protein
MTLAQKQEVKVLDFGLAGFLSSDVKLTRTGARMGTPGYMAPEQHLGTSVDGRTDIYAMGVILYEMATGQSPFKAYTGTDYQLMKAQLELPMPRPSHVRPDIPVALEEMILKATAREPAERYQNAGEFLADIKGASSGGSVDYGLRDKPEPSSVPARGAAPPTILEGEVPASPQTRGGVSDASPTPSRAWIWVLLAILLLGGGATALMLTNTKQQEELDKKATAQERKAKRLRQVERENEAKEREHRRKLAEVDRKQREGKLTGQELERKKAELAKERVAQQARDKKSKEDAEGAKAARQEAERTAEEAKAQAAEAESRRVEAARQAEAATKARADRIRSDELAAQRKAQQERQRLSSMRKPKPPSRHIGWCQADAWANACRPCNTNADCGGKPSSCWQQRSPACDRRPETRNLRSNTVRKPRPRSRYKGWCQADAWANACEPCNTNADCGGKPSSCWQQRSGACDR